MESFKVQTAIVYFFLLFHFLPIFNSLETIVPGQFLKQNQTLISKDESFEAGFFNFGDSNNQYFGVWYKNISPKTLVWIANRDSPLENSSGVLNFTDKGTLFIVDYSKGVMIWSSNSSKTVKKPILKLFENGNLVVKDETNPDEILWQSFDLPGDTLLPGMKIRSNIVNGIHKGLVSWRDTEDPATGLYSYHIDTNGFPQVVITKENKILFRAGSWNGNILSGVSSTTLYKLFNFSFVITDKEVSYGYELLDKSIVSRYMLTSTGQVARYMLSDQAKSWQLLFVGPSDQCDNYDICGANSNCDVDNSPVCECLEGFIPKSMENWSKENWFDGCVRRVKLDCDKSDGFLKYVGMKLPDTSKSWFNKSMNLEECEKFCLKNCSCTAYANLDIRDGGSGCLIWFYNILDVRKLSSGGQDFYIRVAASELGHNTGLNKKKFGGILVGCILFVVIMILLGVSVYRIRRKKLVKPGNNEEFSLKKHTDNKGNEDIDIDIEIPLFDLSTIANSTNNFSIDNKLGQGGFGPVYKGKLENGQDIAVKRLCKTSGQGPKEFINEVKLIANLQHRNLVKLLGCCIHDDERILIYEFMINRSLDYFIFDQTRKSLLHWTQRFQIICGIARGLLYLHEDSRLRIIHRDLKTSNILLDENMNSKISDFGLARTLWGDEAEGETRRVVGTHGYISPEYAARGFFSVKSDVFSFGVIILETISGNKNREYRDYHDLDLLGYAWRMWCEQTPLKLIDECLSDSAVIAEPEILRCIQIGLLCVQERADIRPDMSSVVLMLNGEKALPNPKEPAFYPHQFGSSSGTSMLHSNNEVSITSLEAR